MPKRKTPSDNPSDKKPSDKKQRSKKSKNTPGLSDYDMSLIDGTLELDDIDLAKINQFDQNAFNNFTPLEQISEENSEVPKLARQDSFVFDFGEPLQPIPMPEPQPMQREFSYQLGTEIRDKSSEIVTFSMPIENELSFYTITNPSMNVSVYSGNFTLETPDLCLCLSNVTITTLPSDFATPSGERWFLPEPIRMYNICYKQFYLFSRIFKKIVNCGGKCITNPSFDSGRVHNFTQSSYCCGYYSAVAAVMYRYYQLRPQFPGKSDIIDFSSITMDEINHFVDSFESANASSVLIKLFNLAMSYTSYFSSYILKHPLPDVSSNFLHTTKQNTNFIYADEKIQLATIYATTDKGTITHHHFCTYNLSSDVPGGPYILISDAWAAGSYRRPLWTRFISVFAFTYVIDMLENNTTGLSPEQLEIIKLFFLQPHGSTFSPLIKICYMDIDFVVEEKELAYSNRTEIPGFKKLTYVLGGTKRKKRRIRSRTRNKKANI